MKRFISGDPIPHKVGFWNDLNDVIGRDKGNRNNQLWTPEPFYWDRSVVMVRNDTGGDLPLGSVVGLGDAVFASTDDGFTRRHGPVLIAGKPAIVGDEQTWGVTVEAIEEDGFGQVAVAGMAVVQVRIDDATHDFATPANLTTGFLISWPRGDARIIWREGASGTVWAVIRFRAAEEIEWGKTSDATWTDNRPGSLCTVNAIPIDNAAGDNPIDPAPIDIKLLIPDGKDPLYFEDDKLPYILDAGNGNPYAISPWWDEPIGALKQWHDPADLPRGWIWADGDNGTRNMRGYYTVGWAENGLTADEEAAGLGQEGDYGGIGDTVGNWRHRHNLLPSCTYVDEAHDGGAADLDHWNCLTSWEDNRSPAYTLVWIQRTT